MKKFLLNLVVVVIIIAVAMGCFIAYQYFTKNTNEQEEQISNEAIFTLENYPKVDASLATQPLTDAFISNFTQTDKDKIETEYTNTHPGYVRLINGEVDLIVVTEPSEEELDLAKAKGVELEVIPVVNEAFVFMVNKENPVNSLTLEQIQEIYEGKITNWKEVGGNDKEIKPYQRPTNSGSQTGMLSLVMKGRNLMKPLTENVVAGMAEIINLIADYDNKDTSIGYSYYYYANTMYSKDTIKLLSINGIEPNYETIKNKEYPIMTAYYIVINKNEKEGSNTRKLVEAMLSNRGQQVAKEAGYVPIH